MTFMNIKASLKKTNKSQNIRLKYNLNRLKQGFSIFFPQSTPESKTINPNPQ